MGTFILKRKFYSDEKSGMGTGAKVALGTLGTLGVAAGSFYGARKGLFGARMAKGANKLYMSAGSRLGSKGMIASGAKDYGAAAATMKNNAAIKAGKQGFSEESLKATADKVAKNQSNIYTRKMEARTAANNANAAAK